jgi:2-oxoglutarate ferredoxin oxidoreductase subunit beta
MIFGKEQNKGNRINGTKLEVVTLGENGITLNDILVHDQYSLDPGIHLMLAKISPPEFPIALGVIRSASFSTYDDKVMEQMHASKETSKIKNVDDLLNSGDVFEIA